MTIIELVISKLNVTFKVSQKSKRVEMWKGNDEL